MNNLYKLLIICLLMLTGTMGFSQVLVMEDFNSGAYTQGWSSPTLPGFVVTQNNACDGYAVQGPLSVNSTSPELYYFDTQSSKGSDIIVSFDYKILENKSTPTATTGNFGSFDLQYSTDGRTWTTYYTINQSNHTASTNCVTLTDTIAGSNVPAGSNFGWRIVGHHNAGDNYIYIDNFEAIEDVACKQPTNIQVLDITYNSIKISWDELNTPSAGQWEVAYCPNGIDPSNPACFLNNIITGVTSNPYTLTGLADGNVYDIYVRAVCGSSNMSAWTGPIQVQTVAIGTECSKPIDITSLPYTHTSNTDMYGDNVDKAPGGALCGTTQDFLDGYDVVYKFSTAVDDIIDIDLSGNLSGDIGIFLYASCSDIGTSCLGGAITANGQDFGIHDLYVNAGDEFYIVISTKGDSTSTPYTLDITGFDCATWVKPDGQSNYDFFGQNLSDFSETRIGVNPTIEGAELHWYTDAALTNEITNLSGTQIANNDTYWVTQSVGTCESPALKVTFNQFDCSVLKIDTTYTGAGICDEGTTTLTASASTDNIIWYDSQTGGAVMGMGPTFTTPTITQTTSYWVSQYFKGEGTLYHQANPGPVTATSYGDDKSGVEFELSESILIVDVKVFVTGATGDLVIQLINDNGGVQEAIVSVQGGSMAAPNPVTIPLNFNITDPSAGPFKLVKKSGPALLGTKGTMTSFPYAIGNSGRVTGGVENNAQSGNYYYFYDWTIGASIALCESPRKKVTAVVNTTYPFSIQPQSTEVCVGTNGELVATSSDKDYEYTWTWTDPVGTTHTQTGDTIHPLIEQATTFTVNAFNPITGCGTEREIFIDAVGVGEIPLYPATVEVCKGETVAIRAGEVIHRFADSSMTNWTFVNSSTPAQGLSKNSADWKRVQSPYSMPDNTVISSDDGSSFMLTSAADLGPGSQVDAALITPPINLVGVSSAKLEFEHFYRWITTQPTTGQVLVSTDGGATWEILEEFDDATVGKSNDFQKESLDLQSYLGNAAVYVAFRFVGDWGFWWAIDNVSVVQTYTNGSVAWSGSGVNQLYLDDNLTIPYQGQAANLVYYSADSAGNYKLNVSLSVQGCGQPVTNTVDITVTEAQKPTGDTLQSFYAGAKVFELDVQGTNLQYYVLENGQYTRVSRNAELVNHQTYYVAQKVGGCISEFLPVTVSFICPMPENIKVTVDLAQSGITGSAIIFWDLPQNTTGNTGYKVTVEDNNGNVFATEIVNQSTNYVIVEGLPLATKFTATVLGICDPDKGVYSDPLTAQFNTIGLGVDVFEKAHFTYYPNPVSSVLTIECQQPLQTVAVYDLTGKRIMLRSQVGTHAKIDLSGLASGSYFLVAKMDGHRKAVQLIKK